MAQVTSYSNETFATQPQQSCSGEKLSDQLSSLAQLIANVTEAYTVSIFLANEKEKFLKPIGHHTLSRDFNEESVIPYGSGLIGWTAENKVRISVCPFENDATTLLCYRKDQNLKSFIAVPILDEDRLLGVISCDSKKSYAFAKITEKILQDCAKQASLLLRLHKLLETSRLQEQVPDKDLLQSFLEHIQTANDEETLLHSVARLPQGIIKRNALVIMTCDTAGSGGKFYTSSKESNVGHKLIEMIYRHKRVLCGERSVHALPFDDASKRSFLSVPFHSINREAGSINLLSFPNAAFSAAEISALEKIAQVLGRELERLRLLENASRFEQNENSIGLKTFIARSQKSLELSRSTRAPIALSRISFSNFTEIESALGLEDTQIAIENTFRLLKQIVRPPSLFCQTVNAQALLLSSKADSENILNRLKRLMEKQVGQTNLKPSASKLLIEGLQISKAIAFKDSDSIEGLIARTRNQSGEMNKSIDLNIERKVAC